MRAAFGPVEAILESGDQHFAPIEVRAWTLDEGLSRLYRAECELELDCARAQTCQSWLGRRVALHVMRGATTRVVHGVVGRCEALDAGSAQQLVRISIVPSVAVLEQRIHSRIYAERSLRALLEALLQGAGLEEWKSCATRASDHDAAEKNMCGGPDADAPAFEHVLLDVPATPVMALMQYRESTWAFIERTLAAWGLTYFFRHEMKAPCEQLIIVDNTATLAERDDAAQARLQSHSVFASSRDLAQQEGLSSLRWAREPETPIVVRGHFAADEASVEHRLPGSEPAREWPLRSIEHTHVLLSPSHYLGAAEAARFADYEPAPAAQPEEDADKLDPAQSCELYLKRAGEVLRRRKGVLATQDCGGTGNILSLTPGDVLEVRSATTHAGSEGLVHPPLLITAVVHSATRELDGAFEQSFSCMPLAMPFAAEIAPSPKLGLQTGRVIGPPDADVHVDAAGRVLVQLAWEQSDNEHQSHGTWADLTQAWAGAQFGAFFYPRVGSQVVVALLDEGPGSPILPVVMGCTYNEVQTPPLGTTSGRFLSGFRSRSTPQGAAVRYNELVFDDSFGTERVELRAQHMLRHWAGNDYELRVGGTHDPMHWGLRIAMLVLDTLMASDYEAIKHSQAQAGRDVDAATSIGPGPLGSQPGGGAQASALRHYRGMRAAVALLREIISSLVARGEGLSGDLRTWPLVRRDYMRACDMLIDLAGRYGPQINPEEKSLLLEASRLMRIAALWFFTPKATFDTTVNGSHRLKVAGPSEAHHVGGKKTVFGEEKSLLNTLGKAGKTLAKALRFLELPPTEQNHSKMLKPLAIADESIVYGSAQREVYGSATTEVHGATKHTMHGDRLTLARKDERKASGAIVSRTQDNDVGRIEGRRTHKVRGREDKLYVKQTLRWDVRRVLAKVHERLVMHVKDFIEFVATTSIKLRARDAVDIRGKNIKVKAGRYARVDGKLVTLHASHAVRLEQGGASITLKGGNVYIEGNKVVLRGRHSVDIKSSKTNIH